MNKKNVATYPSMAAVASKPAHEVLASRARDQLGYAKDAQRAFEALERLITPQGPHDDEMIDAGRTDLGHLLRILNAEMRIQLEGTAKAIEGVMAGSEASR